MAISLLETSCNLLLLLISEMSMLLLELYCEDESYKEVKFVFFLGGVAQCFPSGRDIFFEVSGRLFLDEDRMADESIWLFNLNDDELEEEFRGRALLMLVLLRLLSLFESLEWLFEGS